MVAVTIITINDLEKASHHLNYFKPSHQLFKISCSHCKQEKEHHHRLNHLSKIIHLPPQ